MDAVAEEVCRRCGYWAIFVYLDDFLIRGSSREECDSSIQVLLDLLRELKLEPNLEKSVLDPTTSLEYLGKVWDTARGVVLNSSRKIEQMKEVCSWMLKRGVASLHSLESLLGSLEWLAGTLRFSRCWKRFLLMETRSWRSLEERVDVGGGVRGFGGSYGKGPGTQRGGTERRLSPASRRELKWWKTHGGEWIPLRIKEVAESAFEHFHTDASGFAYGATNGLWGLWKEEEKDWNIAIKELEALRRLVCSVPRNSRLKVGCDNMAVYWVLWRGRAFSWDLNNLIRRLGGDVFARNLDLEVYWVPTKLNRADGVSRAWSRGEGLKALSEEIPLSEKDSF